VALAIPFIITLVNPARKEIAPVYFTVGRGLFRSEINILIIRYDILNAHIRVFILFSP